MEIAAVGLRPYRLPLRRPWVAAAATMTVREGCLLAVKTREGLVGWGDCAPLPSSGAAARTHTASVLAAFESGSRGRAVEDVLERSGDIACMQARWAVETALLDLMAQAHGVPLGRWLGAGEEVAVAVNAALGALDEGSAERLRQAQAAGYGVVKLKVGVAAPAVELGLLRRMLDGVDAPPRLRLDANRAWTSGEADYFLGAITDLPIDGVEEPLANPSVAALADLQARLPFALAVDESLAALGAAALLDARAVRRLVVKPARLGGLRATQRLAQQAAAAGVSLVLTSVVDSAVGVTAAAHLAAAVAPEQTHGLATSDWLLEDVAAPPAIRAGRLSLGSGAGLGLLLHEQLL